jgi:uncharacterized protein (DUF1501 family)
MEDLISRRSVIRAGGMIAVGLVAPRWLSTVAEADVFRQAAGGKIASDTILVVCQLSGGNDGLNTIVPYAQKAYYDLRPTIGIADKDVLKLDENVGMHPSLAGLHTLYKENKVAVIGNVGYPKPNRSHFKSMEIWQTASPEKMSATGWLGRQLDIDLAHHPLNPVMALGLSTERPLALAAHKASVPCFASLADVQGLIGDADSERMLREIQGMDAMGGSTTAAVQQASKSALDAMSILSKQIKTYEPKQTYANDAFGNGFKQIAQLIATSPATKIVYFSAGGFDTHARQPDQHAKLLKGFGDAMLAFQREMEAIGKDKKVVVLTFSEFGRRAHENASLGTDHGAAAPMFIVGSKVKGGLHGAKPDLQNLQDGDVGHQVDFREVYAATLDTWMGGDSEVVLGQKFKPLSVFA